MDRSAYQRPSKPRRLVVKNRQEAPTRALPELDQPLVVDSATECHVTPLAVAQRMVEYLGPTGDFLTLEPQAGTGNLIQALYNSGHSPCELVAVERSIELCSCLRKRFTGENRLDPINECFLSYAQRVTGGIEYPRIIMNPPFKQVKKHMDAALSLLGPGGHGNATLVALVPITYTHSQCSTIEELSRDTFTSAQVMTKIVIFERSL